MAPPNIAPANPGRWLLLALLATLVGCSEPTGTEVPQPPPAGPITPGGTQPIAGLPQMILSGPIVAPIVAGGVSDGRVYTSLPPGTIAFGVSAELQNRRNGSRVSTPIIDGGFDPIMINAVVGDTLDIRYRVQGDPNVKERMTVVPPSQPPIIVRTEPVPGKRDVPLNARMVVVFSEPLQAGTLTSTSVQLFTGSAAVDGTVTFDDTERLRATFTPRAPLIAGEDYTLVVSPSIADVDGQVLGAQTAVQFATATKAAVLAIYDRQSPTEFPALRSRLVLFDDDTFEKQYLPTLVYKGRYLIFGNTMVLAFNDSNLGGPWSATATITGDTLGISFNLIMQMAGFEDGSYVRTSGVGP